MVAAVGNHWGCPVTARRYTQAEVADIFAKAEASAEENEIRADHWDGYVLGFVSASLGVKIAKHETDRAAVLR